MNRKWQRLCLVSRGLWNEHLPCARNSSTCRNKYPFWWTCILEYDAYSSHTHNGNNYIFPNSLTLCSLQGKPYILKDSYFFNPVWSQEFQNPAPAEKDKESGDQGLSLSSTYLICDLEQELAPLIFRSFIFNRDDAQSLSNNALALPDS